MSAIGKILGRRADAPEERAMACDSLWGHFDEWLAGLPTPSFCTREFGAALRRVHHDNYMMHMLREADRETTPRGAPLYERFFWDAKRRRLTIYSSLVSLSSAEERRARASERGGMSQAGLLTGLLDRDGREVRLGDELEFDEKEWGEPCRFVLTFENGELVHPGSHEDIGEWCRVVRGWDERAEDAR